MFHLFTSRIGGDLGSVNDNIGDLDRRLDVNELIVCGSSLAFPRVGITADTWIVRIEAVLTGLTGSIAQVSM